MVDIGPGAGEHGGEVIYSGPAKHLIEAKRSITGDYIAHRREIAVPAKRRKIHKTQVLKVVGARENNLKNIDVSFPLGVLTVVTGVSGSGKTTMVLESLIPALKAQAAGELLPEHVRELETEGIRRANLIDATPIGANVRSTVATYADIHDELRRAFARTDDAKAGGWKAGDFSYNTGRLRCPTCDGTGSISLDVQFLPDVTIECPDCGGSRYAPEAGAIRRAVKGESHLSLSLPQLMAMSVDQVLSVTGDLKKVHARLTILHDLGLGYLTLGEPTPALSGGEASV